MISSTSRVIIELFLLYTVRSYHCLDGHPFLLRVRQSSLAVLCQRNARYPIVHLWALRVSATIDMTAMYKPDCKSAQVFKVLFEYLSWLIIC